MAGCVTYVDFSSESWGNCFRSSERVPATERLFSDVPYLNYTFTRERIQE